MNTTSNKIVVGEGHPKAEEGKSGDLQLRLVGTGVQLFAKYKDKWHSVGLNIRNTTIIKGGGSGISTPDLVIVGGPDGDPRPPAASIRPIVGGGGTFTTSSGEILLQTANPSDNTQHVRMKVASGADVIADVVTGSFKVNIDTSTVFDIDPGTNSITNYNNSTNYFKLQTAANGATTMSTVDSDGTDGDFTLDIDGDINLNADGGIVTIQDGAALSGKIHIDMPNQTITMYDGNVTELDDYFKIVLADSGVTTLSTNDGSGGSGADKAGHFKIDADGDITLDAASGNIYAKNDGGNYTPGSDYEIATKKYVDDNAGSGDITGVDLTGGTGISIDSETNTTSGDYSSTITCNLEGTEVVSTGETGAIKFLREDGDNSSSWQAPTSFFSWGATQRLIGVAAGDHVAIATQYDAAVVELGNSTDPDTAYSTSTTADHINMRMVQFPQRIRVNTAIVHWGQGGATNTTHAFHLMRYDVDSDGDLSNGVVLASKTDLNSDDYSQRRYGAMTIDTNNDEVTTAQCIIGTMEMISAVNSYISCKFTLEIQRY